MKKIISFLTSLLLILSLSPPVSFAEETGDTVFSNSIENEQENLLCNESEDCSKSKEFNKKHVVITYGTFDLLHYGHINILKRAKSLGDYLVVGLSTDDFNWNEKHKKCYFNYEQRKLILEAIKYVDLVIPETCWEQKSNDMHKYNACTFVIGDDWDGKFDYLKDDGVEVIYLSRTPDVSTTQIKQDLKIS